MYIINLGAEAKFIVASVPHITIKGTSCLPASSNRNALRTTHTTMPTTEKGTNPPRPTPYTARRSREYLTAREINTLMETVRRSNRHGHRDATMILIAYRHGLRPSEASALNWDQINFEQGHLHVRAVSIQRHIEQVNADVRDDGFVKLTGFTTKSR